MMYRIVQTDKAIDQLRDILFYLASQTGDNRIALQLFESFEKGMMRLSEFPDSGSIPRYSILRKQGFRVILIGNYLVFYKVSVEENLVVIYAIVDSRREYLNLI
jgi:toxin ParE1/3/4